MKVPLSWPELHGALTHFPVALLITACIFEVGAAALKKPTGRVVSFWMLVAAVVMAIPTLITGWNTGTELFGSSAHPPSLFTQHRVMAFLTSGLAIILLAWRAKARDQLSGVALMASITLIVIVAGMVSYVGYLGGSMVFGGTHDQAAENGPQGTGAPPARPQDKASNVPSALIATGQKLFQGNKCLSCHTMEGKGGRMGPELTHEAHRHADVGWQIEHLKNPEQAHPGSQMPAYATLKPQELKALAAYLTTRQ